MTRNPTILACALLPLTLGCVDEKVDDGDGGANGDGAATDDGGAALECDAPTSSVCGLDGALVRGTVRLDPALSGVETTGDLFIAITHYRLGAGQKGGYYHVHTTVEDVDLSGEPVPFELDMCAGGAMWSEDNCEYNLLVILDQNGNQSYSNLLPDKNEPAVRIPDVELSCTGESPCFDVVLDCADGDDCVTFSDPGACSCAEDTCDSDYTTCQ